MRPPNFTILAGLGLAVLRHPACPHGCNYPTTKNSQICHKIRFNPSPPRKKFPQRIKDNSGRRLLAHILREGGGLVTCWAKSGAESVSLLWPEGVEEELLPLPLPDLKFVKKFTRPNFRAKEFYTLKMCKSRLFSPAINSKKSSLSVIWPSFG